MRFLRQQRTPGREADKMHARTLPISTRQALLFETPDATTTENIGYRGVLGRIRGRVYLLDMVSYEWEKIVFSYSMLLGLQWRNC